MHKPSHFFGCGSQVLTADNPVNGFGSGEMMAHRTYSAKSLNEHGNFPVRSSLNESLETAELDYVKPCLFYTAIFIDMNRNLSMSLDSGYGLYDYF